MTRRRVVAVSVVLAAAVAAWRAAPVVAAVATAVVAVVVTVVARRRLAGRALRRQHLAPTLAALHAATGGAPVRLHVNHAMRQAIPRRVRPAGRAAAAVRGWWSTRTTVQTAARWRATAARPATAAAAALARHRRPAAISVTVDTPYLGEDARRYISAVVRAKLAPGELAERWDLRGATVTATWRLRAQPPARVDVDTLERAMTTLPVSRLYLGQCADGAFTIDLGDDSPHIALSAGSGAGKSVLAAVLAVQVLARGGRVIILDRKSSHRWALGHERVTYCATPGDMHQALVTVAAEADERNRAALTAGDEYDPGERVMVLCEELNASVGALRSWWDDHRGKRDPRTSPAVRGLAELAHMGRSAKVHLVAVAQQLTARSLGGGEPRENFAVRALARYSSQTWRMLAPHVAMPPASRIRGRWAVVVAGHAVDVQVPMLSNRDARRLAGVSQVSQVPDAPAVRSDVTGDTAQVSQVAPPLLTIREAVDTGVLPGSLAAVRQRWQRSSDRPEPAKVDGQRHLYRAEDLREWAGR